MTTERRAQPSEASELEGGGHEQTWGQGEGRHEPTIEPETPSDDPATYSEGTAADLDDPDLALTREEEGMDR